MASQKSTAAAPTTARRPQRQRGRERVASLLHAAATVFAEKGYEAATMTEIAERAAAPIGSLYQFFPSKEALADALLDRYGERVEAALEAVEERAASLSTPALADALLDVLVNLAEERRTALILFEVRANATVKPGEFRQMMRGRVARVLARKRPDLSTEELRPAAIVVAQSIKTLANLQTELPPPATAAVAAEWREMVRLYLQSRLDTPAQEAGTNEKMRT